MITIGKPLDPILDRGNEYGGFDISDLVLYYRKLQRFQIKFIPSISLGSPKDDDVKCCTKKSSKYTFEL